jgi:hypothetical protein
VKGFMEKLNTTQIDVLKIDIEGAELDSLELAIKDGSLRNVNQLLFEVHYYKNEYSRFWVYFLRTRHPPTMGELTRIERTDSKKKSKS